MKSKILAAVPDPADPLGSIFIAESAGFARRINLEVSEARANTNLILTPTVYRPQNHIQRPQDTGNMSSHWWRQQQNPVCWCLGQGHLVLGR